MFSPICVDGEVVGLILEPNHPAITEAKLLRADACLAFQFRNIPIAFQSI
jgi:hypothetical protein